MGFMKRSRLPNHQLPKISLHHGTTDKEKTGTGKVAITGCTERIRHVLDHGGRRGLHPARLYHRIPGITMVGGTDDARGVARFSCLRHDFPALPLYRGGLLPLLRG